MNISRLVREELAIRGLIYGIVAFVAVGLVSEFAAKFAVSALHHEGAVATSTAALVLDSALGAAHGMIVYFVAGFLTGWFVFRLAPQRESRHHATSALVHGVLLGLVCSLVSVGVLMILSKGISFDRGDWNMLLVNVALTICFCTFGTILGTFVAQRRSRSIPRD